MCSKIVHGTTPAHTTGGNIGSSKFFQILLFTIVLQVTAVLQANEYTKEFDEESSVKYYDSNQLASNNPIEDSRSEAQCLLTKGTKATKAM